MFRPLLQSTQVIWDRAGLCFGVWKQLVLTHWKWNLHKHYIAQKQIIAKVVALYSFISFYMTIPKGLNVAYSFDLFLSRGHLISIAFEDKGDDQRFLTAVESQEQSWYVSNISQFHPSAGSESWAQEEILELCLFTCPLSWIVHPRIMVFKSQVLVLFISNLTDEETPRVWSPLPTVILSVLAHSLVLPASRPLLITLSKAFWHLD